MENTFLWLLALGRFYFARESKKAGVRVEPGVGDPPKLLPGGIWKPQPEGEPVLLPCSVSEADTLAQLRSLGRGSGLDSHSS